MENQILVPVELIDHNPYQPRQSEDPAAVAEIAESIKRNGLMQTPTARRVDGRYQLAFGHTRLAGFKLNGEECMPLIIRELDDLQMFELGVSENIKRRDLTVIEKARAMKLYMEEFGKTSVDAGEFFGVSDESVRGTVRYLNLPDDVQKKLANNEITQSIARTLLSLQKIAPAEVISETVERMKKSKDRWGMEETPEEVIEDVLEDLGEVKEMWGSYRDGKPRGGSSDAWLLDMKNFPNKFLPVLTPVDAAIALGIQDDEAMMEKAATWIQASLGELPDLDTESLGIPDVLEAMLDHLINPPACTACPFYSVVNGTHYCGMETCFNRKTRAWDYEKLRAASKDLGIEIYNKETDGEFRVLEEIWSDNGKKHVELFRKRSKDLRLALLVDIDRKRPQSGYRGVPSGSVVMLTGKTIKNLLETGQKERAQKRSKEHAAAVLANLTQEKREALDWEVAGHVKTIFDGLNLAALNALWDSPQYSGWKVNRYTFSGGKKPSKDDKDSVQEEFLRQLFALNMVKTIGSYYRKTISEYAAHLAETVKGWGVRLPKSVTKLAAQMDEEIKAVSAETGG
jgi:ParB/RepB/Spo0J family partition protein